MTQYTSYSFKDGRKAYEEYHRRINIIKETVKSNLNEIDENIKKGKHTTSYYLYDFTSGTMRGTLRDFYTPTNVQKYEDGSIKSCTCSYPPKYAGFTLTAECYDDLKICELKISTKEKWSDRNDFVKEMK